MQILTTEMINERSMELYADLDSIQDEELKIAAKEWIGRKIESMKRSVGVLEDDDFMADLLEQLDELDLDKTKLTLFKKCIIPILALLFWSCSFKPTTIYFTKEKGKPMVENEPPNFQYFWNDNMPLYPIDSSSFRSFSDTTR